MEPKNISINSNAQAGITAANNSPQKSVYQLQTSALSRAPTDLDISEKKVDNLFRQSNESILNLEKRLPKLTAIIQESTAETKDISSKEAPAQTPKMDSKQKLLQEKLKIEKSKVEQQTKYNNLQERLKAEKLKLANSLSESNKRNREETQNPQDEVKRRRVVVVIDLRKERSEYDFITEKQDHIQDRHGNKNFENGTSHFFPAYATAEKIKEIAKVAILNGEGMPSRTTNRNGENTRYLYEYDLGENIAWTTYGYPTSYIRAVVDDATHLITTVIPIGANELQTDRGYY